jgi:putative ABC transport system substrate-binding protein
MDDWAYKILSKALKAIALIAVFIVSFLWLPGISAAEAYPRIAVLYPEVREPYNKVFQDIVNGIEAQSNSKVKSQMIAKDTTVEMIEAWLQSEQVESIVTLGNGGMKFGQQLSGDHKQLAGAVFVKKIDPQKQLSAITLIPSPAKMFSELKKLAPHVEKVTVIYDPQNQQWLINTAAEAAEDLGLNLEPLPASSVHEAANIYQALLRSDMESNSSIWLLQGGPGTRERSIIEEVLKKAWDENLVVFSSNPSHVKRGALFSLYPDNVGLGKSLAAATLKMKKGEKIGVETLEDLQIAVNIRTADHIGLDISRARRREFNLVFPAR